MRSIVAAALCVILAGCGEERAPADRDMTQEEYTALCVARLGVKTAACRDAWGFGTFDRWDLSQDAGTLTFSSADGIRATCSVQIIGSISKSSGTWLWSWDNPTVEDALKAHARRVREHGREKRYTKLTTAKWPATEDDAWEMVAIACELCGAQGGYRGPYKGGALFMTFDNVRLSRSRTGQSRPSN